MSKMQRTKGRTGEYEVRDRLRTVYGRDVARGLRQTRAGAECCDVEGTPWWVEAKRGKAPSVWAAMAQAKAATDGRPPLVVVRRDYEEAYAFLRLEDLLDVLRRLEYCKALVAMHKMTAKKGDTQ